MNSASRYSFYLWLKKYYHDMWLICFTIVVIWFGVSLRNTQASGRKNRIQQDQALQTGEILVCTKSLGVISGILSLAIQANPSKPDASQLAIIKEYFSLANPKQCPTLIHPVK